MQSRADWRHEPKSAPLGGSIRFSTRSGCAEVVVFGEVGCAGDGVGCGDAFGCVEVEAVDCCGDTLDCAREEGEASCSDAVDCCGDTLDCVREEGEAGCSGAVDCSDGAGELWFSS